MSATRDVDIKIEMRENAVCAAVGKELVKYYPGWRWWVDCSAAAGVLRVYCLDFSSKAGFIIHLARLAADPELKMVVWAGGEILERYGFAAGAKPDDAAERIQRDRLTGEAQGDMHGADR